MLKHQGRTIFSASDIVNFMGCAHATSFDSGNLTAPNVFPPNDESAVLLQQKGIEHELGYLERLRAEGRSIVEVPAEGTLEQRVDATRRAMREGPDVIYQGAFLVGEWHGYSDFLLKRDDMVSAFGPYAYDVADTKLARSAKAKHVLQLCVYAEMLAAEQGVMPASMHVVLGTGEVASLPTTAVVHYYRQARERFEAFVGTMPAMSGADPCGHCRFCRWIDRCDAEWEATDHLSIVAGMGRSQIAALRSFGVSDIGGLAAHQPNGRIPGLQAGTVAKLAAQAKLQHHHRTTGERRVEILPAVEGRGFGRMPLPDQGDMFFDMEGDPLFEGGLEYLFGVVASDRDGEDRFHAFWAHDREAEKVAFEALMDFVTARIARYPNAHVYHYAAYEETALKRLAMYHGTREKEVDDLLRGDRLVDLYKVVSEAIRTSEPRYSIKNMEAFYLPGGRQGEVKTAGDSIVIYERWRQLGGDALLQEISDYNEVDCRSTRMCRDWLMSLRSPETPWFTGRPMAPPDPAKVAAREEADERTRILAESLLADDVPWRRLLVDLLEFHRREAKPTWWAMFARQDMDDDELLNDAECIAGLQPHPTMRPWQDKKSIVHPFVFPPQDFKMKVGDKPLRSGSLEPAGEIVSLDEDARTVELKLGPSRSDIEFGCALIPEGPVGDKPLRDAVHRYATDVAAGGSRYPALTSILRRDRPRLSGRDPGQAVVAIESDATAGAIDALRVLEDSYLLVQGPPGAGKTYTSSQAIVALLAAGKRIAVASNSHKAINNLLKEVQAMVTAQGLDCRGMKKSSREDQKLDGGDWIEDVVGGTGSGVQPHHRLVAGTAWLFAREELDQAFDYIFVDEAGQVSLANVLAMGTSARNVVLVGDQMQLSQPIKGTHPGGSGRSALEHLLEGHATVPADQGVFLPITRRMHPDLCRFVSDAVYEGRLEAEETTAVQRIEVDVTLDPEALAACGLRFVDVDHLERTQRSPEEVDRLAVTYRALIGSHWIDRHGKRRRIGTEDILVVSPYNMQVELLKRTLPEGARVGTVDKLQGQEAPVVLVSMATSSGDDLPRNIEFLYSRNRMNVAISRARCLAVIYANPRLLEIPCSTIAQMELVDGLCWARQFAAEQAAGSSDAARDMSAEVSVDAI